MEVLLVVGLCLILNALLAAAEMAFVTASKPRLRELLRSGHKRAELVLRLRERPERTLSVIQIGITLVGAAGAAAGGVGANESLAPILAERFELSLILAKALAIVSVVVPITIASVVFGELVPKTLALRDPIKISMRFAPMLALLDQLLLPAVNFLEWSTKRILKIFFPRTRGESVVQSQDTVELDSLSHQARQYVLNLVTLEKLRIKDVLVPWAQVDWIDVESPIEKAEEVALRSGHTRLPIVRGAGKEVVGIVNTKELLPFVKSGETDWTKIIRPVPRSTEQDSLLAVLRQMQERRSHLSVVFRADSPIGIVTMEDVLEEIIGDVYDEDDDGALKRILGARLKTRI